VTDPLVPVLAGEHAVIWAYGVIGPLLDGDDQDRARTLLVEHERARDQLRARIVAAGGDPPVAEPAYELPTQPADSAGAHALAAEVEARLAAVYADLVAAATDAAEREIGVRGIATAALRSYDWGGSSGPFPGLPERAG
jgi:hypothetical protein